MSLNRGCDYPIIVATDSIVDEAGLSKSTNDGMSRSHGNAMKDSIFFSWVYTMSLKFDLYSVTPVANYDRKLGFLSPGQKWGCHGRFSHQETDLPVY